jgi:hypothetical protein
MDGRMLSPGTYAGMKQAGVLAFSLGCTLSLAAMLCFHACIVCTDASAEACVTAVATVMMVMHTDRLDDGHSRFAAASDRAKPARELILKVDHLPRSARLTVDCKASAALSVTVATALQPPATDDREYVSALAEA